MSKTYTTDGIRRLANEYKYFGVNLPASEALIFTAAEIDRLRGVLAESRRIIRLDRESLYECHRDPKANAVIDAPGLAGLKEYDDVLSLIDAALADGEGVGK